MYQLGKIEKILLNAFYFSMPTSSKRMRNSVEIESLAKNHLCDLLRWLDIQSRMPKQSSYRAKAKIAQIVEKSPNFFTKVQNTVKSPNQNLTSKRSLKSPDLRGLAGKSPNWQPWKQQQQRWRSDDVNYNIIRSWCQACQATFFVSRPNFLSWMPDHPFGGQASFSPKLRHFRKSKAIQVVKLV